MNRIEYEQLIIGKEWDMFQNVHGIGGRAPCQDQFETFVIMRGSQFEGWPVDVLESYLEDLTAAEAAERNLLMEKYAYMMEETDPEYFASIRHLLPPVADAVREKALRITAYFLCWEKEVGQKYPNVRRRGRPTRMEGLDGTTSIENYLKCELYTYSERTLSRMLRAIEADPKVNRYEISMEKMVQAYGYASLAAAEKALSA